MRHLKLIDAFAKSDHMPQHLLQTDKIGLISLLLPEAQLRVAIAALGQGNKRWRDWNSGFAAPPKALPKRSRNLPTTSSDVKNCLRGYSSANKSGLRGSSLIQYHSYSQNLFLDQPHQPGRAADSCYSLNPGWTLTGITLVGKTQNYKAKHSKQTRDLRPMASSAWWAKV